MINRFSLMGDISKLYVETVFSIFSGIYDFLRIINGMSVESSFNTSNTSSNKLHSSSNIIKSYSFLKISLLFEIIVEFPVDSINVML